MLSNVFNCSTTHGITSDMYGYYSRERPFFEKKPLNMLSCMVVSIIMA